MLNMSDSKFMKWLKSFFPDNETPKFPEDLGMKLTPASDFGTPVKDVICFPDEPRIEPDSMQPSKRRKKGRPLKPQK